jgi:hypothetical protein
MSYHQRPASNESRPLSDIHGRKELAPALRTRRVNAWARLSGYDRIEVFREGRLISAGLVDDLTDSGGTIWIHKDNGPGRILF